MGDYPDYTDIMQIIGSDIMVPMDIQAAYIMMPIDLQAAYIQMPVDIQSQYVTLDINIKTSEALVNVDIAAQAVGNIGIDIKAQTVGNINVDIAAQTVGNLAVNIAEAVTLNIDITAQTIADLKINIDAQNVGVYLQPEWSAKRDEDKVIRRVNDGYTDYPVPGTKTLYIGSLSFHLAASVGADADKNQIGAVELTDQTAGLIIASVGGNGGGAVTFATPLIIPGGHTARLSLFDLTNHDTVGRATAVGYEI